MLQVPSTRPALIALLTDFGLGDSVGVMKGVIARISPFAHCLDLSHEIAPQQVSSGAWILATNYRYFPEGTIFVCVVDPGVGSSRRPIAISAGSWFFVGPDNGLFSYILAEQPVHEAVALTNPAYHLSPLSTTFHGRDLFSPVAAHLSLGTIPFSALGESLPIEALQRLPNLVPQRQGNQIAASIVHVDHFGNLITSIPLSLIPDWLTVPRVRLRFPDSKRELSERRRFFAQEGQLVETGQPFLFPDSSDYLAIAVRNGNAAQTLGVNAGASLIFELFQE
jgi:S-adenosylmethionine hydrolase